MLLLWLVLSLASYFLVIASRGQRFDLFPRWAGARAVLRGETPYSDEITWQIQEGMFGQRLEPGEDQQRFAYLATITWPLLPFWLLPFPWAASLWCGLQLLLLLVLPIWVASILGWQLRSTSLVLILIFSILIFRYPINAYLIGQFIPFCLACLVAGWWGIVRGHWIAASLALVLAMVRPEVVMIPLLAILAVAWEKGDRRIIFAWLTGMLSLWFLTRAWMGPWESDYIKGILAYQAYSSPIWPPSLLKQSWLALLIVIVVVTWSAWMWRESRSLDSAERLGWLIVSGNLTVFPVASAQEDYSQWRISGLTSDWRLTAAEPLNGADPRFCRFCARLDVLSKLRTGRSSRNRWAAQWRRWVTIIELHLLKSEVWILQSKQMGFQNTLVKSVPLTRSVCA